jgi:hypothetical protein
MRRILVAKALTLAVFGLYLAIAMSRAPRVEGEPAHSTTTAQQELLR